MFAAILAALVSYSFLCQCYADCPYENMMVKAGETHMASDCKRCYCPTECKIQCTVEDCRELACRDVVNVPGQCCPVCASDLVSDALGGNE